MLQLKIKIKSFLLATRRQNARNCFDTLLGANFLLCVVHEETYVLDSEL